MRVPAEQCAKGVCECECACARVAHGGVDGTVRGCARAMLSVIAMRRPEDEELGGRGDGDEFVDISQMQLLVEAGPSGLHYGGPPPPHAQPQPYAAPPAHPAATTQASVDDLFALYFTSTPTSHGEHPLGTKVQLMETGYDYL